MYFAFTEDQQEIAGAVRETLLSACTPDTLAAAVEGPPADLRETLAELCVLGVNLPEDLGGLEMGPTDWVLMLEAAGYCAVPLPLAETIAAGPMLVQAGMGDLAARVAAGEAAISLMLAGGYAQDADVAEAIFLLDGGAVSVFESPSLTRQRSLDETRRLFAVEGERRPLGADGAAAFDRAALATAAQLIGLARKMQDMAVDYAKVRRQFGVPIGAQQAVQHHLADALLAIEFAAPAVYRAAWSLGAGDPDASRDVSMAKALAGEAARTARKKALQVHGAIGYALEYDLHWWLKRSIALEAAWGDAAWHRGRVATSIL